MSMKVVHVEVFSRSGCHLCDVAVETLEKLQNEMKSRQPFEIQVTKIDGDTQLEKLHGEYVPVIHIDGKPHDFYRVDEERFTRALLERQ